MEGLICFVQVDTKKKTAQIPDSCDGVYHYGAASCGRPGSCFTHECFWHAFAALSGINDNDMRRSDMLGEWEVFSAEEMASNPHTQTLYTLVSRSACV